MFSYAAVARGARLFADSKIVSLQPSTEGQDREVGGGGAAESGRKVEEEQGRSNEEESEHVRKEDLREPVEVEGGVVRGGVEETLCAVTVGEEVESKVREWSAEQGMEMEEDSQSGEEECEVGEASNSDRPLTAAQREKVRMGRDESDEECISKRSRVEISLDSPYASQTGSDLAIAEDLAVSESDDSDGMELVRREIGTDERVRTHIPNP